MKLDNPPFGGGSIQTHFIMATPPIPSVNFHLWQPCNMRCRFCFATFQDVKRDVVPKGHLPQTDAVRVVEAVAKAGFQKITFAGGEPLLCPWLPQLIKQAKALGMITMVVTNGATLTDSLLNEFKSNLDWIALSIDSLNTETNLKAGRAVAGRKSLSAQEYLQIIRRIRIAGVRLKINTVVHQLNWQEDMSEFIERADPERWKILQVLADEGQNDEHIADFLILDSEFSAFVRRHAHLRIKLISETNENIRGTYAMIDPAGRFFDNTSGKHLYSEPILQVGISNALKQIKIDYCGFINREGLYDW